MGSLCRCRTLGQVTAPLCAAVSSSAELLPLILVWQAGARPAPTRLPGRQPRLTPALHPAELSKAQAQRPLSDKLDEPDASDSEVGPRLRWGPKLGLPQARGRVPALTTLPHPAGGPEPGGGGHIQHPGGGAPVLLHQGAWAGPATEEEVGPGL